MIFRENMVIVIQPNLITEDEKMGLQFGETLVVTKKGCESFECLSARMGDLPGIIDGAMNGSCEDFLVLPNTI